MIFSESADKRLLEKLMIRVPNFRTRGHGVIVMQSIEYEYETAVNLSRSVARASGK